MTTERRYMSFMVVMLLTILLHVAPAAAQGST